MKDNESFEALLRELEKDEARAKGRAAKVGEKVSGEVVSVDAEQVFVTLGGKFEGIMDAVHLKDEEGNLKVAVGDTVEAMVTDIDQDSGALLLGPQQGRQLHGMAELEHAFRNQLPVEGQVGKVIKGGLEVQVAGQRAFCPASQVDTRFIEDLSGFVGERLSFLITKLEGGKRPNIVVSRRTLLEEEQRARAEEVRAALEVGAVLSGNVTKLMDYGAFVDLGGIEGMIHISELALGHVKHPSEVLTVGQPVEVAVLRIEKSDNPKKREKIALSIRALAKDPWQDAHERYPAGTRVKGTVKRLQTFGAFVEVEPGLEGLVHISELGAGRRVNHPDEVISAGQEVEATVLGVDIHKRRMSLTLDEGKQPRDAPPPSAQEEYGTPKEGFGTLGDVLRESMKNKR